MLLELIKLDIYSYSRLNLQLLVAIAGYWWIYVSEIDVDGFMVIGDYL